jgi:hypothetical protein
LEVRFATAKSILPSPLKSALVIEEGSVPAVKFVGAEKQKSLIKITKLPDQYSFLLDKELLVQVNEDLISVFDEESVTILIEQEIDKISVDTQSGKIKLIKPDLTTFSSLISKYGVDKVAKANQIEELYQQQVKDGKEEFIA